MARRHPLSDILEVLAKIIGWSVYEETKAPTIDVVKYLRAQRLRWAGHVLQVWEAIQHKCKSNYS